MPSMKHYLEQKIVVKVNLTSTFLGCWSCLAHYLPFLFPAITILFQQLLTLEARFTMPNISSCGPTISIFIVFLQKGEKFKDKTSYRTLNLFHGQTVLNLVRDNKHGRIRKPGAQTCPTLCISVIKLVPSPSKYSPFLDLTMSTMQK